MAAEIRGGTIVYPRQCSCRYRRECRDGRQYVSPILFELESADNRRCVCGQGELYWSGGMVAAVRQRERHSLGNIVRLRTGLCRDRRAERCIRGWNYDGHFPRIYQSWQCEYVVRHPVRAVERSIRETIQACSRSCRPELFV